MNSHRNLVAALVVLSSLAAGRAAQAANVGYSLTISEGINFGSPLQLAIAADQPLFVLQNTSDVDTITAFSITIGNLDFRFDALSFIGTSPGLNVTSFSPDTVMDGVGVPQINMTFNTFNPGGFLQFRADIDMIADGGLSLANFRKVMTGGADPGMRAMLSVTFSDGTTINDTLSQQDIFGGPSVLPPLYSCKPSGTGNPLGIDGSQPAVPEPSTWALIAIGACAAFFGRRRLRRS